MWPISAKDEKRKATTDMRKVRLAIPVSPLEHRRNEEIMGEGSKGGTDSNCHDKEKGGMAREREKKDETENIKSVADMKMEGKRLR